MLTCVATRTRRLGRAPPTILRSRASETSRTRPPACVMDTATPPSRRSRLGGLWPFSRSGAPPLYEPQEPPVGAPFATASAPEKIGAGLLLTCDGDVLLLLRNSIHNNLTWGLPGGNVEEADGAHRGPYLRLPCADGSRRGRPAAHGAPGGNRGVGAVAAARGWRGVPDAARQGICAAAAALCLAPLTRRDRSATARPEAVHRLRVPAAGRRARQLQARAQRGALRSALVLAPSRARRAGGRHAAARADAPRRGSAAPAAPSGAAGLVTGGWTPLWRWGCWGRGDETRSARGALLSIC